MELPPRQVDLHDDCRANVIATMVICLAIEVLIAGLVWLVYLAVTR